MNVNFEIEDLFDEVKYNRSSNDKDYKDPEKYYSEIIDQSKYTNETTIRNFLLGDELLHSTYDLAVMLCNHIHKKVPSAVHFEEKYSKDIIDFFIKNAELMYRNISQTSIITSYIFMYKNIFFTFEKLMDRDYITSLCAVHPIDISPPFDEIEQYRKPHETKESRIGIIKQSKYGLSVSKIKIESEQEFHLDHYNDDFSTFFYTLTSKLKEKKPGLFLFHGEPGTGKSSAIRHLISQVKRNFIFIPPQMINQLSTPEFADIITDTNKGSVLILEDAEKALMKRESEDGFSNSTLVSSVLNLTDGLYADLGNIAIIATYNCDRNLIDSALLRKGRMKAEYKFDKLAKDKSQALMDKLGHKIEVAEDMTLADIFNYEDQYTNVDTDRDKKPIGFAGRPGF